MSDDLVKRLRNTPNWKREGFQDWKSCSVTYDRAPFEAADRIEELEAELLETQDRANAFATKEYYTEMRAERAEAKLATAVEALQSVVEACDQGRMMPCSGVGGMTIEANIRGSVYTGVPALPIENARATLVELKGQDDGQAPHAG